MLDSGVTFVTFQPEPSLTATTGTRSTFTYDLLGRLKQQSDYQDGIESAVYSRSVDYNAKGQIETETTSTRRLREANGSTYDIFRTITVYGYGSGTDYALGSVVTTSADTYKNENDGDVPDTFTSNHYAWYDNAVLLHTSHDSNTSTNDALLTSDYTLNGVGQLRLVHIHDGRPRYVNFGNDENGQIVIRKEDEYTSSTIGDPVEYWYRFNGRQWGMTGNNGSTAALDHQASIGHRQAASPTGANAAFANTGGATPATDFTQSYDPINSYSQGSTGGSYTVRAGDTLQGIALAVWGDANLWYKLAEANGLSAGAALIDGQSLILPSGINSSGYNADTLRPYDPQDAIGDTSPTAPKPPKKNKCAVVGMILLAVIAIAITAITATPVANFMTGLFSGATGSIGAIATAGAAVAGTSTAAIAGGIVGGALVGAASSIVSQGVGVATGLQDKFSWKAVGLSAIGGGIGGGLGASGEFGKVTSAGFDAGKIGIQSGLVDGAVRGIASSALTQGIGVATGLQTKFNWAGIAAAGVAGGVGYLAGGKLPALTEAGDNSISNHFAHLGTNAASALANAATRSVLEGTSFGDNILAALPDVIAQTIGTAIVNGVSGGTAQEARLNRNSRAAALAIDEANGVDPDSAESISGNADRLAAFQARYAKGFDLKSVSEGGYDALLGAQRELYSAYVHDTETLDEAFSLLQSPVADLEGPESKLAPAIDKSWSARDAESAAALGISDIVVNGRRGPGVALGLRLVDNLAIQAGGFVARVGARIDEIPGARLGLTILGYAVDAAAGPIGFAVRQVVGAAVGAVTEQAVGGIANRARTVGYGAQNAALMGVGLVLGVGLLISVGRAVSRLPQLATRLRNMGVAIVRTVRQIRSGGFAGRPQLLNHFNRHGSDFGARTPREYARQAQSFLSGPLQPGVLQRTRTNNGDIVRYDPATDRFGVIRANGVVRTFYRPAPSVHGYASNLDYFNAQ